MKKNFILTTLFLGLFLVSCKDETPVVTPETNPTGLFNWKISFSHYNRAWNYYTMEEIHDDKYPSSPVWYKDSTVYQKTSAQVDSIISLKQGLKVAGFNAFGDDTRNATAYKCYYLTKTVVK
jgi:hypothetical protein